MQHSPLVQVDTESDVEQKIVYPLLSEPALLDIPPDSIRTKEYLAPTKLEKGSGRRIGYYPDYSIWILGHPILIVEAKDPAVSTDVAFREASLYAYHLNVRYKSGLHPCQYVIGTNGTTLQAGLWDQSSPLLTIQVADIKPGTSAVAQLVEFCGIRALERHAKHCAEKLSVGRGIRPFNLIDGQALLNAKLPLNSFAADLSPILRRYFSSSNQDNIKEIAARAYVSTAETTEYDRVLEALLKDRISPRRDTIVEPLRVTKHNEPLLTRAIQSYADDRPLSGQLQIIQGSVGAGKSLFARRYRDLLEPPDMKLVNYWAFVDFNSSPPSLSGAEQWLSESFLASLERENPELDLYDANTLRGIFSRRIQQRKAYYAELRKISRDEERRERARDLEKWQSDSLALAEGTASYLIAGSRRNLIVVMDNVDKLDLDNQLQAFQLSLWFMEKTRAFIMLQMRDETYERYKNRPPLDTYRSGIAFHIAPPRFINVVKRRLELSIEYLAARADERQEYILDNGARIVLPRSGLGDFLRVLYLELFGKRNNIARVLEALSGKDVRRSLEMFVSIVTSGHLSTSAITSKVRGEGLFPISEYHVIKILMRTDYRLFSDNSGYIFNIFDYSNEWTLPDNFIYVEILFFLALNRKTVGSIGLEGYFSVRVLSGEVEKMGYEAEDLLAATNRLLQKELIVADHLNSISVGIDDCIKIQAAGFIHVRVLCERLEYLYGLIPVVPIADRERAQKLADVVDRESKRSDITPHMKARAVEVLYHYLRSEFERTRPTNPFYEQRASGAAYIVRRIEMALNRFYRVDDGRRREDDELDAI